MVKKAQAKSKARAKAKPTKSKPKVARSGAHAKSAAKYDQPGAPWWKRMPLPVPK